MRAAKYLIFIVILTVLMQVIDALLSCHRQHPLAKFWGACNEEKWALDKCFRVCTSAKTPL